MKQEHKDIIKDTLPLVKDQGLKIVTNFYQRLFEKNPQLEGMFNMTHQVDVTQRQALLNSIIALAEHIENPEKLGDALDLIAHKHASVGVTEDHYPIVATNLMEAICDTLQIEPNSKIHEAWLEAVKFAAGVLIGKEKTLYGGRKPQPIEVALSNIVTEATDVKSFIFKRTDGKDFKPHIPGQYVSLDVFSDQWDHSMKRQYTITGVPQDTTSLQITTKLDPEGTVSRHLHLSSKIGDVFSISEPFGNFTLDESNAPILFVSAGIGITPIYSLLKECERRGRKFHLVHGDRSVEHIPFYSDLKKVPKTIFLEEVRDGFEKGYVDLTKASIEEQVYLCGPQGFMQSQIGYLRSIKMDSLKIKYEFFGSLEDI